MQIAPLRRGVRQGSSVGRARTNAYLVETLTATFYGLLIPWSWVQVPPLAQAEAVPANGRIGIGLWDRLCLPYDCLLEAINAERYQQVDDALRPIISA